MISDAVRISSVRATGEYALAAAPKRVLVVDDDVINRALIEAILDAECYEIVHAATGEEAVEVVSRETIDLVLLDVVMPGIDGIEVCRRIRQDLGRPLLPIVLISALTDAESRTRGKQAGADDFLTKPIHADELVIRTRNLLLMREYYTLSEAHRHGAEVRARRWQFVSDVATSLAGCLDYDSVTAALGEQLQRELGAEATAFCEVAFDGLRLVACAPRGTPGLVIAAPALTTTRWLSTTNAGPFARLARAMHVSELVVLPVVARDQPIGVFCVGRHRPFERSERDLFEALRPHVSNVLVSVRSHVATVADLLAKERARKQTEAALELSEERHHLLFEGSPLPIWTYSVDNGQIVAANAAFVKLCGYSRAELREVAIHELVVAGTNDFGDGHRKLRCKHGGIADLDVTSHPLTIDGQPVRVAIGLDVTHTRLVEEQLRQSQKMEAIGRLAGGVAHDFNNILAAIIANAELARDVVGEHHPITQEVKDIQEAARIGADLTRQLLAFSRNQRGEAQVFGLASLVRKMEALLTRLVDERVAISINLARTGGVVRADASQIEQVVMNLVVNAKDAMPGGGHLTIETADVDLDDASAVRLGLVAGGYVTLTITDTGHGMEPSIIERIFEPFFTTKEVGKGTGLGLATVFGIVKDIRGAITVKSSPGAGSTFRVYLPRVEVAETAPPTPSPKRCCSSSGKTILLVEDNEPLRSALRRQLAASGHSVISARDGADALAQLANHPESIELLVTDLVMPGIDGRALANRIVAERPHIKILLMSGYTDHAAVTTAEIADSHFIAKPFTHRQLTDVIANLLDAG